MGRLGDPGLRLWTARAGRGEACVESIRRALEAGESERPVVAPKRGNARGAKGPWQNGADSKGIGTELDGCKPDLLQTNLRFRRAKLRAKAKQDL